MGETGFGGPKERFLVNKFLADAPAINEAVRRKYFSPITQAVRDQIRSDDDARRLMREMRRQGFPMERAFPAVLKMLLDSDDRMVRALGG